MLNGHLRLRFCDLPLAIWYYLHLILEDHMKIIALVGILALVAFAVMAFVPGRKKSQDHQQALPSEKRVLLSRK